MENIMLNSIQNQIKIVDFGLSNIYTCDSPLRTHCGSPEYAAPELFVPGKSYGPKVDLWSLGVIFYGMMVGQLPFISPAEDNISSQERRKRLLIQINRGFSSVHRKALTFSSSDFRNLIAKMLMSDSLKRINIIDLIIHPWVTDKGLVNIRSDPLKKPGDHRHLSILKQVGSLLQLDYPEIQYALSTQPHGDIAGMYKLLLYSEISQNFLYANDIPSYATARGHINHHSSVILTMDDSTTKKIQKKDCDKSANLAKQYKLLKTNEEVLRCKHQTKTIGIEYSKKPKTVAENSYGVNTVFPNVPARQSNTLTFTTSARINISNINESTDKKASHLIRNAKTDGKTIVKKKSKDITPTKTKSTTKSANDGNCSIKRIIRSEPVTNIKSAQERKIVVPSVKRDRVLPVVEHPSLQIRKHLPIGSQKHQTPLLYHRQHPTTRTTSKCTETSPLATGDVLRIQRPSNSCDKKNHIQRAIVREPIARSIAGYLVNKISNFKESPIHQISQFHGLNENTLRKSHKKF